MILFFARMLWIQQSGPSLATIFFIIYVGGMTVTTSTRFLFAGLYHPKFTIHEPTVSVVIPAYNEEVWIEKTAKHCLESDYPNLIEVIVVNDGSTDKTLEKITSLKKRYPKLRVITLAQNQGKRVAMIEGAEHSRGEILVFVDSDSFVEKDAIKEIVKPFVKRDIKAVVGHADAYPVLNTLMEKIQYVWYYIGFKLSKSAESLFGAVTCLSGCLAAYKREEVLKVKEKFLNQKVFGVKTAIGDDRSLTTLLLKKKENKIIYQPTARTVVIVPDTLKKFLKQRLRWKKSWVRESLLQSKHYWNRGFLASIGFYTNVFVGFAAIAIVTYFIIYEPITGNFIAPLLFIAGCFAVGFIQVAYYLWYTNERSGLPHLLYTFVNTFILSWLTLVAILKIRDNSWGTRGDTEAPV
jgi:hyaluronan synthase